MDFLSAVNDSKPTLFLCYATWCGHCQRFSPVWEKIKKTLTLNKDVHVVEVNYDAIELMPKQLQNVRGFPTLQIVVNGKVKKEYSGERDHDAIVKFALEQVKKRPASAATSKRPTSASTLKKKKVKTV